MSVRRAAQALASGRLACLITEMALGARRNHVPDHGRKLLDEA